MGGWSDVARRVRDGKIKITEARGLEPLSIVKNEKGWYAEVYLDKKFVGRSTTVWKDTPFWGEDWPVADIPGPGIVTVQLWKETNKGLFSCTKGKMVEQWYKLAKNDNKKKEKELTAEVRIALFNIETIVLPTARYNKLADMLFADDLSLLSTLGMKNDEISPAERVDIAELMCLLSCSKGKDAELLSKLLVTEIENTKDEAVLFRGNSIGTKALDFHFKLVGRAWLDLLLPLINTVANGPDLRCEVVESKMEPQDNLEENFSLLQTFVKRAAGIILSEASVGMCPTTIRRIFYHMHDAATKQFPTGLAKYTALSGFLFLRFFVPAIMTPKLFQLSDKLFEGNIGRTFVLLASILQKMGNFTTFEDREKHLNKLNPFINDTLPRIREVLEFFSSTDNPTDAPKYVDKSRNAFSGEDERAKEFLAEVDSIIKETDETGANWPEEVYPEPPPEEPEPVVHKQLLRRKSLGLPGKKIKVDFRSSNRRREDAHSVESHGSPQRERLDTHAYSHSSATASPSQRTPFSTPSATPTPTASPPPGTVVIDTTTSEEAPAPEEKPEVKPSPPATTESTPAATPEPTPTATPAPTPAPTPAATPTNTPAPTPTTTPTATPSKPPEEKKKKPIIVPQKIENVVPTAEEAAEAAKLVDGLMDMITDTSLGTVKKQPPVAHPSLIGNFPGAHQQPQQAMSGMMPGMGMGMGGYPGMNPGMGMGMGMGGYPGMNPGMGMGGYPGMMPGMGMMGMPGMGMMGQQQQQGAEMNPAWYGRMGMLNQQQMAQQMAQQPMTQAQMQAQLQAQLQAAKQQSLAHTAAGVRLTQSHPSSLEKAKSTPVGGLHAKSEHPPTSEGCFACGQAVTSAQMTQVLGRTYHKACWTCTRCRAALSLTDFHQVGPKFVTCTGCYNQLLEIKKQRAAQPQ